MGGLTLPGVKPSTVGVFRTVESPGGRYTDQWNTLEGPEIAPHNCAQLIFDKGATAVHQGEDGPLTRGPELLGVQQGTSEL